MRRSRGQAPVAPGSRLQDRVEEVCRVGERGAAAPGQAQDSPQHPVLPPNDITLLQKTLFACIPHGTQMPNKLTMFEQSLVCV